jgi:pilus assembly protein Flp/PilA
MIEQLKNLAKDEEAPTAVEYALMVAGIALAVILAVTNLGGTVNTRFTNANTRIGAMPSP